MQLFASRGRKVKPPTRLWYQFNFFCGCIFYYMKPKLVVFSDF